jgi:hypothetical protein
MLRVLRVVPVAAVAAALVLAGCDGGGSKGASDAGRTSTTRSTSTKPSSTSSPSTTVLCRFGGSTSPQRNAVVTDNQLLSAVTTGTAPCEDTVTFTFLPSAAPAPSYVIEYSAGPFADSAGRRVKPPGTAYLRVRFQPAWIADFDQPSAPLTYTGPRVISPTGTKVVRGLAIYAAEEGVVGWIVGLDGRHPIKVDASPGRVSIAVSSR